MTKKCEFDVVKNDAIDEKYYRIKHKSGLDVYVFPKDLETTFAIIGFKYGSVDNIFKSRDESDFVEVPNGIAHFLEHKMFENADGTDSTATLAAYGADANAFTSFCGTSYLFSCTENAYDSLRELLKMVSSPYFAEKTVKKEQGIITQEIRMCEDNPGRAVTYGLLRAMYKNHPVRVDIAGSAESISKITPELLYRCHKLFYAPSNAALCVCGRVDADKVLRICDEIYPAASDFSVEKRYPDEPKNVARKRIERDMRVSKKLFSIGVKDMNISPDPEERMKKDAALSLIEEALFSHSGDFYCDLYAKSLLGPSFDTWYEHNSSFSFFTLTGDSDDPDLVLEEFEKYVEKVRRDGIPEEELERARRVVYSSLIKDYDSPEDIACNLITDFALDGGEMFEYSNIVKELDGTYVFDVFCDMFREDRFAISIINPIK